MGRADRWGLVSAVVTAAVLCVLMTPTPLTPRVAAAEKLVECPKKFRGFKAKYLPHRAIATTQGRPLSAQPVACGFSGHWGTKAKAISEALRECETSARIMKLKKGQCRIMEAD